MQHSLIPPHWRGAWQEFYQTFKGSATETKPHPFEGLTGTEANNPQLRSALTQLCPALQVPASWGLSPEALVTLSANPGWIERLIEENRKPPLPPKYTPVVVEFWFDDILFVRWVHGQISYLRSCPKTYQPPLMEVYFDDQLALSLVVGEVVVNRVTAMARMDSLLGRLAA
jgi:hypothetical protein